MNDLNYILVHNSSCDTRVRVRRQSEVILTGCTVVDRTYLLHQMFISLSLKYSQLSLLLGNLHWRLFLAFYNILQQKILTAEIQMYYDLKKLNIITHTMLFLYFSKTYFYIFNY